MKLPKELTSVTPLSKYLSLFLLIALPFIGFYLGFRYQEQLDLSKETEENSTLLTERAPSPTPLVVPTVDPSITANWKTYTNTEIEFSLLYPPDGKVQDTINEVIIYNSQAQKPPYYYFYLEVKENLQNFTAEQIINNQITSLRQNKNSPNASILADKRQSTVKEYKNGEISGIYMRWGSDGDSVNDSIQVISVKNEKIYNFSIHDGNGSVEEFQRKLFDQILSTFQFSN